MIDWSAILATNAQAVMVRAVAVAVLLGFHGGSIALLAKLLGDRGPEYDGRLSLNPSRHVEPVGALVPLFFRYGWILPVEVDPAALRGRAWGLVAIVLGSLALLLVLAFVLWQVRAPILLQFPRSALAITLVGILEVTADLALRFAVLNLVPLPPLTAGMVLAGLAPALMARLRDHMLYVALAMGLLVALGVADRVFGPLVAALRGLILS
jgi:hypothetical protein